MAMRLLRFRLRNDEILAEVWLDTSKTVSVWAPAQIPDWIQRPDPTYVTIHRFPRTGEGLSQADYRLWIIKELKVRCMRELDEINRVTLARNNDGVALPGEGEDFIQ